MIFARKVWNFLVAVKDGLVLLFMLLFFLLLYAALTVRPVRRWRRTNSGSAPRTTSGPVVQP